MSEKCYSDHSNCYDKRNVILVLCIISTISILSVILYEFIQVPLEKNQQINCVDLYNRVIIDAKGYKLQTDNRSKQGYPDSTVVTTWAYDSYKLNNCAKWNPFTISDIYHYPDRYMEIPRP